MTEVGKVQATTVTVRKGQGLTQALLALVKKQKMEISDGVITAAEWDKTIDKLEEIQANRKKNGQASIFTGNTDRKDYKKSFVVHPEQEIEFTKAEMGELYEAMGVSFSKTTKPEEDKDTKTGEDTTPEERDFETGEPNSTIETPIYDEEGNQVGTKVREYDENGKLAREKDKNADDKIVKDTVTVRNQEDGKVDSTVVYDYDENEKMIKNHIMMKTEN